MLPLHAPVLLLLLFLLLLLLLLLLFLPSPFPIPTSRYSQQQSRTAAQRHILTENPELMMAGDQLMQREMDEYHHHQLTSSFSSYSDTSSASTDQRAPLSPTTHMLVLPDDDGTELSRSETFV